MAVQPAAARRQVVRREVAKHAVKAELLEELPAAGHRYQDEHHRLFQLRRRDERHRHRLGERHRLFQLRRRVAHHRRHLDDRRHLVRLRGCHRRHPCLGQACNPG